jgi:acetylornithine deacetylase/succinyl-diaminopimelate desuccinylase-like protein
MAQPQGSFHLVAALAIALPMSLALDAARADLYASRQTAASQRARAGEEGFRALYKELVEINTTLSVGSCTEAVTAMKTRLLKAGYAEADVAIVVPPDRPKDGNLVALLPGTDLNLKPLLLLAHVDVVEANREDWERDPFTLIEEDGYFYARGSADDKAMAAIFTDSMIRFRQEGYAPRRGIKLALTCGEETPNTFNGVRYLVENHRALIDAAFALNEGARGEIDGKTGRYVFNGVQAGEKLYQDFTLETTNPGGHSARPRADNAIYDMAAALAKIEAFEFPFELNDTTRRYFSLYGEVVGGALGADMKAAASGDAAAVDRLEKDPTLNGSLRTTCIATEIEGGHAKNALPQHVSANVNCRIFPGHSPDEVLQKLVEVIGNAAVEVSFESEPEKPGAPPKLGEEILGPVETLSEDMYPGVPVIPMQSAGATDGRFLTPVGIPTYGVSGIFSDSATTNAHGLNERMRVQSLLEGREFLYRLAKLYAERK